PMGGYADRVKVSTGTADDLEVNILVLGRQGSARVAWVAIDSLAVTEVLRAALVGAVQSLIDIDSAHILCCPSHSHSTPAGWVGAIHPVLPAQIDAESLGQVARAVASATLSQVPVSVHAAVTSIDGVGSNRHDVNGPHDRSAAVLTARRLDTDAPLAVMFDFACHPTVLGPDNTRWSADWVAGARQTIRRRLGAGMPVVFQQGCAGDVSPRFHRRARDHAEAIRLGGIVGTRVADAALEIGGRIELDELDIHRKTAVLPRRAEITPGPPATSRVMVHERLAASIAEGQRSSRALAEATLPGKLQLPITMIRLGHCRWLHVPVELFSSFGLELRVADPQLRVIGYTDGYAGYVADADAHRHGDYEALSSFFDLATSRHLVDECRDYVATR
ncbi:MAG: hypothetical protein M3Y35_09260, partial [Actinomycetota bacterium]|nr:hypothetical protein [Actinomycetota bacterium]